MGVRTRVEPQLPRISRLSHVTLEQHRLEQIDRRRRQLRAQQRRDFLNGVMLTVFTVIAVAFAQYAIQREHQQPSTPLQSHHNHETNV